MASKHLLTGTGILLGVNTLSAQAPAALHSLKMQETEIINTVQVLEQHAMTGVIAVAVLTGLAWIGCLCHACLQLNKSQNPAHARAKNMLLFVFVLIVTSASAQKDNTWRGGAPGHETEWSYSKNWSNGRVPNEFDRVLIPDVSSSTNDYPVIKAEKIEVSSLRIQEGAMLTLLPNACLLVEEVDIQGVCQGCERRILLEGNADAAANFPKRE